MCLGLLNLGPSAPFVAIALLGVGMACLLCVATVAMLSVQSRWKQLIPRRKTLFLAILTIPTFLFWGASTGRGGPSPGAATTGYTHAGVFRYATVTSHQTIAGAPWSHDVSLRLLPLLATIAANAAVLLVLVKCFPSGSPRPQLAWGRGAGGEGAER